MITTCPVPGLTYIKPLWYHIVGSGNKRHLKAGTEVRPFYGDKLGHEIASIYASKMDQKARPPGYSRVGGYWGCSRDLTAPMALISGA